MEYSLWNMHGPTLWPSTSTVSRTLYSTVNGETIEDIQGGLPVVTTEEIHANDLQVGIHTEIHGDEYKSDITGDLHSELQGGVHESVSGNIEVHTGVAGEIPVQEGIPTSIQGNVSMRVMYPTLWY